MIDIIVNDKHNEIKNIFEDYLKRELGFDIKTSFYIEKGENKIRINKLNNDILEKISLNILSKGIYEVFKKIYLHKIIESKINQCEDFYKQYFEEFLFEIKGLIEKKHKEKIIRLIEDELFEEHCIYLEGFFDFQIKECVEGIQNEVVEFIEKKEYEDSKEELNDILKGLFEKNNESFEVIKCNDSYILINQSGIFIDVVKFEKEEEKHEKNKIIKEIKKYGISNIKTHFKPSKKTMELFKKENISVIICDTKLCKHCIEIALEN